ncbi:MAG: YggT family protein [Rickettsiales bacterium]|nr:YggT family protein [Rickettsiales bacterium]
MLILVQIISLLLSAYSLCVVAWLILTTLLSFNVVNRTQRLVMLSMYYLNRLCGPPLRQIRRLLPNTGQIDLSPIVLLLLIGFAQDFVVVLALGQNPLFALVALVARILQIIIYCLIAQMVVSMLIAFNIVNRQQPVVSAIYYALEQLMEPLTDPIRRIIPPAGPIDLAPLALILLLGFCKNALTQMLFQL